MVTECCAWNGGRATTALLCPPVFHRMSLIAVARAAFCSSEVGWRLCGMESDDIDCETESYLPGPTLIISQQSSSFHLHSLSISLMRSILYEVSIYEVNIQFRGLLQSVNTTV